MDNAVDQSKTANHKGHRQYSEPIKTQSHHSDTVCVMIQRV